MLYIIYVKCMLQSYVLKESISSKFSQESNQFPNMKDYDSFDKTNCRRVSLLSHISNVSEE